MGQREDINLKLLGLFTHPNKFSEAPIGALLVADNVTIDKESIAQTRRGQKQYGTQLSATGIIDGMFEYQDKLIIHYDSTVAFDSDNLGTWSTYPGTLNNPAAGFRIRGIKANKNFYFNTDSGVKKLSVVTGTPMDSGAYKALGGVGATNGASGFMTNNTAIAYRLVWGYYDANDNFILGTPSQRIVVTNSSGATRNVLLSFDIPTGVQTTWTYQLYRSNESATALTSPDDELQLVYENKPSAGEISAKSVSITDTLQNDLKGASLYTNQSQQGILQSNDQPPYCKDMTTFKNYVFYANTKTKQRYSLNVVAVGSPSGIQIDDTIVIAGVTYTGKAIENVTNREFLVYTAGTPSQNIDATTLSLITVINQAAANTTVYAYYLSGFDDIPGKLYIEERSIGGATFALTSSRSTCWSPRLPSSGTTESSNNEESPNRVYISKVQQPESVPPLNYIDIGSADSPIRRILSLRDSVMVFKDDGVFRITGTSLPLNTYPFNNSIKLKGSETAVVLDNRIFAMTDQGVVSISDVGVEILSRPIETSLISLTSDIYTNFETTAFGVGYESDRRYILYTVSTTADTFPTQAWTYHTITQGWTRWTTQRSSGLNKESDDKLYTSHPQTDYVYQERKTRTIYDYADEEFQVTILSATGTNVVLASTANCVVNQTLRQGDTISEITNIVDSTNITVFNTYSWTPGSASVNNPINTVLEWTPQTAGNLSMTKHWSDLAFIFDDAFFNDIQLNVSTNFVENVPVTLSPISVGSNWGEFAWGGRAWGGALGGSVIIRTLFPKGTQRSHWAGLRLTAEQAFTSFSIAGVSMWFDIVNSKMR